MDEQMLKDVEITRSDDYNSINNHIDDKILSKSFPASENKTLIFGYSAADREDDTSSDVFRLSEADEFGEIESKYTKDELKRDFSEGYDNILDLVVMMDIADGEYKNPGKAEFITKRYDLNYDENKTANKEYFSIAEADDKPEEQIRYSIQPEKKKDRLKRIVEMFKKAETAERYEPEETPADKVLKYERKDNKEGKEDLEYLLAA